MSINNVILDKNITIYHILFSLLIINRIILKEKVSFNTLNVIIGTKMNNNY